MRLGLMIVRFLINLWDMLSNIGQLKNSRSEVFAGTKSERDPLFQTFPCLLIKKFQLENSNRELRHTTFHTTV